MHVQSAAALKNLAYAAVVPVVALGSRHVEMPATQSLSIHGLTVSRLAKVGKVERLNFAMCVTRKSFNGSDFVWPVLKWHTDCGRSALK